MCEISVTKSGERASKFALPAFGFLGDIQWYPEFIARWEQLSVPMPAPVNANGKRVSLRTAVRLDPVNLDTNQLRAIVYEVYDLAGVPEDLRTEMGLTAHAPHGQFDAIATALIWPEQFRKELGRWSTRPDGARGRLRGQSTPIHAIYATRPACENQLHLRSLILKAMQSLTMQALMSPEAMLPDTSCLLGEHRAKFTTEYLRPGIPAAFTEDFVFPEIYRVLPKGGGKAKAAASDEPSGPLMLDTEGVPTCLACRGHHRAHTCGVFGRSRVQAGM